MHKENVSVKEALVIKHGFPPKRVDLTSVNFPPVKNGDAFIVEIDQNCLPKSKVASQIKVPSDGACLFNSINLCLGYICKDADEMRGTVATIVLTNP